MLDDKSGNQGTKSRFGKSVLEHSSRNLEGWLHDVVAKQVGTPRAAELSAVLSACARGQHMPESSQILVLSRHFQYALHCGTSCLDPLLTSMRAVVQLQRTVKSRRRVNVLWPLAEALINSTAHCLQGSPHGGWRAAAALAPFASLTGWSKSYNNSTAPAVAQAAYGLAAQALQKEGNVLSSREWTLALNGLARGSFIDVKGQLLLNTFECIEAADLGQWSPMDVALLCNSLMKLQTLARNSGLEAESSISLQHCWFRLLSRVAGHLEQLAPRCGDQDVAHLMAAFVGLVPETLGPGRWRNSKGHAEGNLQLARGACRAILKNSLIIRHVEVARPEGLCAILVALARLGMLDADSVPVFRSALQRVARGGLLQFEVGHLSHLSHAFSMWVFTKDSHAFATEVASLFKSTLRPAILRAAGDFAEPRHIAFAAAAMSRMSTSERLPGACVDVDPALDALARRVLHAQGLSAEKCEADPLRWEHFPGWALSMFVNAFAQLDFVVSGELFSIHDHPIAQMLESLIAHLLEGRLCTLEAPVVCRLAGAFCWAPRGMEVCRGALDAILGDPSPCNADDAPVGGHRIGQLGARDAVRLLAAMARLELHDGVAVGQIVWHLHGCLWNAAQTDLTKTEGLPALHQQWDLQASASCFTALGRLGVMSSSQQDEAVCRALACIAWATSTLLEDVDVISEASNSQLATLIRSVGRLVDISEVQALPWTLSMLEHVAHAASTGSSSSSLASRDWCDLLSAMSYVSALSGAPYQCVARLRSVVHEHVLFPHSVLADLGLDDTLTVLATLAAAGIDDAAVMSAPLAVVAQAAHHGTLAAPAALEALRVASVLGAGDDLSRDAAAMPLLAEAVTLWLQRSSKYAGHGPGPTMEHACMAAFVVMVLTQHFTSTLQLLNLFNAAVRCVAQHLSSGVESDSRSANCSSASMAILPEHFSLVLGGLALGLGGRGLTLESLDLDLLRTLQGLTHTGLLGLADVNWLGTAALVKGHELPIPVFPDDGSDRWQSAWHDESVETANREKEAEIERQ